ncbi:hypothetical protein ACLQ24_27345 [Micromonospora sp. DT4]|uniref:hypothetical protein n=1 Tax=Micromonospora sp. DT4 TaxID=3393438 RepID=UPI003CF53087
MTRVRAGQRFTAAAAYPIHDAQLNERGLASVAGWFAETIPGYRHLAPGDTA